MKKVHAKKTRTSKDMTADDAKKILGWEQAENGEHKIVSTDGEVIHFSMTKNRTNVPLRIKVAEDYADQMLRGVWSGQRNHPSTTGNGEPIVIDWCDNITSGQHRLLGLIIAQDRLENTPDAAEEYGWKDQVIVPDVDLTIGVDPKSADTNDTGKKRDLRDVLSRVAGDFFDTKERSASQIKKLCEIAAHAARLVYLRTNGERVAGGSKLPPTVGLAFLKQHPILIECVVDVFDRNGGSGEDGKRISNYVTLGYAAGLMYLMAHSSSDPAKVDYTKKPRGIGRAKKFWQDFAEVLDLPATKATESIKSLYKVLNNNRDAEVKFSRDQKCTVICRAWLGYCEAQDSPKKFKGLKPITLKKNLSDFTRIGGIDIVVESTEPVTPVEKKGYKIGQLVWVNDDGIDPWQGEIETFTEHGTVEIREKIGKKWGDTYETVFDHLTVNPPELVTAE